MLKVEDSADRTFGSDPVPLYGIRNGLFLRLRERIILAEARGTLVLVSILEMKSPLTFVLVHGAWAGGWCWRRVTDLLRKDGHLVFTPTLTGFGEGVHLT